MGCRVNLITTVCVRCSSTWVSAVSSTLFTCQWTSIIVLVTVLPLSTSSTLTRQSNSEDVFLACQDVHARMSALSCATERASPGVEDNIERYRNSPVMHEAVPAQYKPLLFDGGVPVAFPAPTKSIRFPRLRNFNLSHSKRRRQ